MISIIIPTLNEEKYLPLLLESIKKQTFKDYEIIVSDSNSKDNTRKIANKFGCRVDVHKEGSPAKARNSGAKLAKEDILLFLDADVILRRPNFIESNFNEFKKKKLVAATSCVEPTSKSFFDNLSHTWINFFHTVAAYTKHPRAPGYCIFIKKNIFKRIQGFDENLKVGEDSDLVKKASKHGKFGVLHTSLITSPRRWEQENKIKLILKWWWMDLRYQFNKPIMKHERLDYRFGDFE